MAGDPGAEDEEGSDDFYEVIEDHTGPMHPVGQVVVEPATRMGNRLGLEMKIEAGEFGPAGVAS